MLNGGAERRGREDKRGRRIYLCGSAIWREEEGGRDPCCGFRRFGEATDLAREHEPRGENSEASCEEKE
jgi:hypothetical protein